jgi:aerobic-type carbon monoxide dehydrogenase small subunit (CoxS/CutS family)
MTKLKLNGKPVSLDTDEKRTLLWVLRGDMQLTGTKYGCGIGACGACTVVVDGEAKRACQLTLGEVSGKSVTTIEGLEQNGKLHPLQQAFIDHGAFQCGFCTSGMLMSAYAMLKKNPHPSRAQVVDEMDSNLCRCGAHQGILNAIAEVAK